jgi:hypothetical protein
MSDILKLPEFVKYVILKDSPEIRRVVNYDRFFQGKGAYMAQVPSGKEDGSMIIDAFLESQVERKFYSKDEAEAYKQEKGQHTPTPDEEAIYAGLLTVQAVSAIVQAYTDGKIKDLETYNHLYEAAKKADTQVQKLARILKQAQAGEVHPMTEAFRKAADIEAFRKAALRKDEEQH